MSERKLFKGGKWEREIDVRDFIQRNYTEYVGDSSFLSPPTEKTKKVWSKCVKLLAKELENGGVLDVDTERISGICNFEPGYIDKENEVINEERKDYGCYKILRDLVENNPDFRKKLQEGIAQGKIYGFNEDVWEKIALQNIRNIDSFETVFKKGYPKKKLYQYQISDHYRSARVAQK